MLLTAKIPPLIENISLLGIIGYVFATIIGIVLIINVIRK